MFWDAGCFPGVQSRVSRPCEGMSVHLKRAGRDRGVFVPRSRLRQLGGASRLATSPNGTGVEVQPCGITLQGLGAVYQP